jgi:hypothetical protein
VDRGHSLPKENKGSENSEHKNNSSKKGALTHWRAQKDRHICIGKESKQVRVTHPLKGIKGETL